MTLAPRSVRDKEFLLHLRERLLGDKHIATASDAQALHHLGSHENVPAVSMDVTNEAQVRSSVRDGLCRFDRADVLVNNAGIGVLGAVEESTAEEVDT